MLHEHVAHACMCVTLKQIRKRRQAPRTAAQKEAAAKEVRDRKVVRKEAADKAKKAPGAASARQPQNVQKGNVSRAKGGR